MAAGPAAALVLFAAAFAAAAPFPAPPEDPFAGQLGDLAPCRERCGRSLRGPGALPGEAQDAVLSACFRGCRLFSICRFVGPAVEPNATRAECESACMEAYRGGEEQFGCLTGCRTQMPLDAGLGGKAQEADPPSPFSVLGAVSSFCNDIVSSAQSFISSTWTFYLQADDGKVLVFQSQPEAESPVPEVQAPKLEPPAEEEEEASWTPLGATPLKPLAGNGRAGEGLREKLGRPPVEEATGRGKGQPPADSPPPPPEHDFLGCMSKRSGLPRWILAACLFLSVVVMLWLSCASLVTAPDHHVKAPQPLSINGDKEFLEDLGRPVPFSLRPVIAVAICPAGGGGGDGDEEEMAGPLPVKVDLDKTAV